MYVSMENKSKLNWSALEYEEKERGNDWFWALGIIIFAGSITSFIYGNFFFGLLLIIGGVLIVVFSLKKPDLVFYELNEDGLEIKNRLYPYGNIKAFWIEINTDIPTLFIKSERMFAPVLSIPIKIELANEIREFLIHGEVKEEKMEEHVSHKIMNSLGF